MNKQDNFYKYTSFRNKYKFFSYEKYSYYISDSCFHIKYEFNLNDTFYFKPTINIPQKEIFNLQSVTENVSANFLNNIIFNIGMVELLSYWKTTCSPKIIIKPHFLTPEQISFWKKLYYNGLGEFLYLNSIQTDEEQFCEIYANSGSKLFPESINTINDTLIPIGGGKDSVVTLELLSSLKTNNLPLILNPRGATLSTISSAGYSINNIFEIQRTIHPQLLKLNEDGFLNGHTPFSALLAFISILAAVISGKKNIALSNESSANESTIVNTNINHQYSKTYEFERDFRIYVKNYISDSFNYFSFLRPLNELQIAKLFSGFPKYFPVFKSCNAGSKTDIWCGVCSKCLFTYIILSPFITSKLLMEIFGKNLLDDINLRFYFDQLIGIENTKPFDCIGTPDEINTALVMTIRKTENHLPRLLEYYKTLLIYKKFENTDDQILLHNYNKNHFLTEQFENILIQRINA
ncbi:MAG TPA: hypothetical protein PKL64_01465 [Bacteroidales bacterium]|nr:hypothetical protein [Bacteroidales bacterium]